MSMPHLCRQSSLSRLLLTSLFFLLLQSVLALALPLAANASIPLPGSTLLSGNALNTRQDLLSPSGEFFLTMQSDGNLCAYHEYDNAYVWCSRSSSAGEGDYFTALQTDGNLCTYRRGTGPAIWCIADRSRNDGPYFLAIQDDANVCVYRGAPGQIAGTVWCSMALGTSST